MKILAIASAGGHWIQLLRLAPAFEGHDLIYMSTKAGFEKTVENHKFYLVPDANRNNKSALILNLFKVAQIVFKIRPDVVVTTGAAPGLMGIIGGRLAGCKTIWIDSIANVEKLSLSGQIALRIADRVYTQWPDLANENIVFEGNVLES